MEHFKKSNFMTIFFCNILKSSRLVQQQGIAYNRFDSRLCMGFYANGESFHDMYGLGVSMSFAFFFCLILSSEEAPVLC